MSKELRSIRSLTSSSLRYFLEVARAGSFRKAADHLNIAPSALHRQIALLEADVGTPLIDRARGKRGLRLTAPGEVLVNRTKIAMNEMIAAMREIEGLRGFQRGRVSIGTNDVLSADLLPEILEAYSARQPKVEVRIVVDKASLLVDMLLDQQLDVILSYNVPPLMGVEVVAEYALSPHVVVPNDHPLASEKAVKIAQCAEYPIILPDENQYLRGILEQMFYEGGIRPQRVMTTNSFSLMRDMVGRGTAIAIQTYLGHFSLQKYPSLKYIPLHESAGRFSLLSCCVKGNHHRSLASEVLIDIIGNLLDRHFGNYRTRNLPEPRAVTTQ